MLVLIQRQSSASFAQMKEAVNEGDQLCSMSHSPSTARATRRSTLCFFPSSFTALSALSPSVEPLTVLRRPMCGGDPLQGQAQERTEKKKFEASSASSECGASVCERKRGARTKKPNRRCKTIMTHTHRQPQAPEHAAFQHRIVNSQVGGGSCSATQRRRPSASPTLAAQTSSVCAGACQRSCRGGTGTTR